MPTFVGHAAVIATAGVLARLCALRRLASTR